MPQTILLALSTFPDVETARRISNQLVSDRIAACANILPAVESIYRWKDKIQSGNEALVFFKLSEERQSAFQDKLRSLHPYEVPEIIFVPVANGLPEYVAWVMNSCGWLRRRLLPKRKIATPIASAIPVTAMICGANLTRRGPPKIGPLGKTNDGK